MVAAYTVSIAREHRLNRTEHIVTKYATKLLTLTYKRTVVREIMAIKYL